jgi:hypothetical protein
MVSLPIGALRNKMKYPKVTKQILKADYVQVTWSDINSDSSWKTLKDAMNSKVTICISTGWLIRQDKDVHTGHTDTCTNLPVYKHIPD